MLLKFALVMQEQMAHAILEEKEHFLFKYKVFYALHMDDSHIFCFFFNSKIISVPQRPFSAHKLPRHM